MLATGIRVLLWATALAAVLWSAPASPQAPSGAAADPLVVGETFTLRSTVLGEVRRINVYLPDAYDTEEDPRLPVLYMPDGGRHEDFLHIAGLVQISSLNGTMRPFILVGIENTERRRDLTGPTSSESDRQIAPRVGGSAAFRAFIRGELMPEIDARYRTTGETAIVGESLAGLFVVETLLVEPGLFDTYLAIDPSLWWDDQRLVDTALELLDRNAAGPKRLFLAASATEGIAEPTARLAALLADAPDIETVHLALPTETHATVYHPAALQGFRRMLSP